MCSVLGPVGADTEVGSCPAHKELWSGVALFAGGASSELSGSVLPSLANKPFQL